MNHKKFREQILKNSLITLFILWIVVITTLIQQLNISRELRENLYSIEYLSSGVQRLSKLAILGQDGRITLSYLEDEIVGLLDIDNNTSISMRGDSNVADMVADILVSWDMIQELVLSENLNTDTLYLVSDNFYYKITALMIYIENKDEQVEKAILLLQLALVCFSAMLSIVCLYIVLQAKTEQQKNESLVEVAARDNATGLYNRSRCQEVLRENSKQFAVVVFDLNDLKVTNDLHGHRAGDALISSFATVLQTASEIHPQKPFLGRYGGDEFVVIYQEDTSQGEIEHFLGQVGTIAEETNKIEELFQLSYAVGFAVNTVEDEMTGQQLFDKADGAMYLNKQKMKNQDIKLSEQAEGISGEMGEQFLQRLSGRETVEQEIQEKQHKNLVIVAWSALVMAVSVFCFVWVNYSDREYIGGNVLYLSDEYVGENRCILSPWKNGSISTVLLYQSLFLTDETYTEIMPSLVKNYEVSEDGLTYSFTLVDNQFWSDGTQITLEDVVFSFEAFLLCTDVNVNLASAFYKILGAEVWRQGQSSSVEGISVDGNRMTITLQTPHNTFMKMLTQFVILPKHILEHENLTNLTGEIDYYIKPISSGMYCVEGRDENGDTVFGKNPYYQGEQSEIESIVMVANSNSMEIDYKTTNVISEMVDYRARRGFEEFNVDMYFYRYFVYNVQGEEGSEEENPMADLMVREALLYALDREELLNSIYFNAGVPIYAGAVQDSSIVKYTYRPEYARGLLEDAGYDFDRPITIMYYYSDGISYIFLEKVTEFFEAVGLQVELVFGSTPDILYQQRPYDLMLKGLSSFNEEDWYNEFLSTNPSMSQIFGTEGYFDEYVYQLGAAIGEKEYDEAVKGMIALEQELVYKMPLFTLNQSVYINTERVQLPDDITFGNTWYRSDLQFEDWKIKKS